MTLSRLISGAALSASLIAGAALAADAPAPQTRENLSAAMHGEAFVNLLDEEYVNKSMYINFADEAGKAGDVKTAAMFRRFGADEGDHHARYRAPYGRLAARSSARP